MCDTLWLEGALCIGWELCAHGLRVTVSVVVCLCDYVCLCEALGDCEWLAWACACGICVAVCCSV